MEKLNRRTFMGTSTLTAAGLVRQGFAGLPKTLLASTPLTSPTPVRIKTLFLAKPVPTWPTPHLDVEQERRKLQDILAKLEKEMPDVIFEGGELLRTIDDVPGILPGLGAADGILIFNLTSTVGHMIEAIAQSGRPAILFSQPYSGHDWSGIAEMQDAGLKIDVIASSDYHDLVAGIRPIRTIKRLGQSKILVLQRAGRDDTPVSESLGVRIVPLQHARLMEAYAAADSAAVEKEAERWVAEAVKIVEPSREEIVRSARLYLGMRQVMEEEEAQAITINCLGLFYAKKMPAYPCLGFARLNDAGLVGACEADLESTVTMLIFQYLAGKPGFISDPVIDTATNSVIHAHCVAPTCMDGQGGERAPYVLRSHMEDDKGAVVQVRMRIGQTITMAKLVGQDLMLLSTGEIVDTPVSDRGCRTQITTRVSDPRKLLERYRHGLHRVIFYGDHCADIERLGKFLRFKVAYEA